MSHPVELVERADCLILRWRRPGNLRALAVGPLLVILLYGLASIDVLLLLLRQEGEWFRPLLWQIATTWWLIGQIAISLLLLVLDGQSRHQLVWADDRLQSSWLYGPIELFVETHARHPDEALIVREHAAGARSFFGGDHGRWQLLLTLPGEAEQRQDVRLEVARFAVEDEAQAWRRRLLDFRAGQPAAANATATSPLSDTVAVLLPLMARMPALALFGICLSMIGVAGESLAMRFGRAAPVLPWDSAASARLERFALRVALTARDGQPVVVSELQAAARFIDSDGAERIQPLASLDRRLNHLHRSNDGPRELIEQLTETGWRPGPLRFELPASTLAVQRRSDGVFDFSSAATRPAADILSSEGLRHWRVLAQLDAPVQALIWLWSEPTMQPSFEIVYRDDARHGEPAWLAAEADTHAGALIDHGGLIYVLAVPAVLVGGFLFLFLAPLRHDAVKIGGWLLIVATAWWWGPRLPGVPDWLDFNRGPQAELRLQLARWLLNDPRPLQALGGDTVIGEWRPDGSRYAELLRLLDLAAPPERPSPDAASARQAIAATARRALDGMSGETVEQLLAALPARQLRLEGNSWLIEDVIAPGLCARLAAPAALARVQGHRDAIRALGCDRLQLD